jgi:hypothetical protein
MPGALDTVEDSRFALRFERKYSYPPARVWLAMSRPDQLSHWFDQMIDYDRSRLDSQRMQIFSSWQRTPTSFPPCMGG